MLKSWFVGSPLLFSNLNVRTGGVCPPLLDGSSRFWMSSLLFFASIDSVGDSCIKTITHLKISCIQMFIIRCFPLSFTSQKTIKQQWRYMNYVRIRAIFVQRMCLCRVMLPSFILSSYKTKKRLAHTFHLPKWHRHEAINAEPTHSSPEHCKRKLDAGAIFARSLVHHSVPHNISNDENLLEMPVCCSISSRLLISSVNVEIRCAHGMYCSGVIVVT